MECKRERQQQDGDRSQIELGVAVDQTDVVGELAGDESRYPRDDEDVEDGRADDGRHAKLELAVNQTRGDGGRQLWEARPDGDDQRALNQRRQAVAFRQPFR